MTTPAQEKVDAHLQCEPFQVSQGGMSMNLTDTIFNLTNLLLYLCVSCKGTGLYHWKLLHIHMYHDVMCAQLFNNYESYKISILSSRTLNQSGPSVKMHAR